MPKNGDMAAGCLGWVILGEGPQDPIIPSIAEDHREDVPLPRHQGERGGKLGLRYQEPLIDYALVEDLPLPVAVDLCPLVANVVYKTFPAGETARGVLAHKSGVGLVKDLHYPAL